MKFYLDTSVWGGYFDKEFSNVTFGELILAPAYVRELVESIPENHLEFVTLTEEQEKLANAYIKEGVLTEKFYPDAQHIAIATVLKTDSLVSWNFKHMVNFFRIRQYNSVNLKFGYSTIDIRTPKEVIYEK